MDESGDQNTNIDGNNNTVNNVKQSASENQVILPKEIYRENLENAVRVKELEMQATHGKEREIFQAQIDKLNNDLANLPQAFEKAQTQIAELKAKLEREGNAIGAEKLAVAITALEQGDFSKADDLFAEIEAREELAVKRSARAAFARGEIAEQEVRWHDAAKHFARAAHLDPCFNTLNRAQKSAFSIGNYDSAVSFSLQADEATITECGEDSIEYATILNNRGTLYRAQKLYEKAELFYQQALKINTKELGEEHPQTATNLDNLAVLYLEQNRHKEAFPLFNKALKIYEKTLGKNHHDTAICINNFASNYHKQGNYKKAILLHKQALKICKQKPGQVHPQTANCFNNLGGVYNEIKHYKKANSMFRQALEIFETTLGPDHPHTKLVKDNYENNRKHLT